MENNQNIEHIVWDGDNTIWDWMEYAVPAYEGMCEAIAEIAHKSFDETAAAMKAFYSAAGTLEHEGLIQGLQAAGFFRHLTDFSMEQTIRTVQRVFGKIRRENLRTYPGISTVMRKIRQRGLEQIVITDAPGGQASARLRYSRLGNNIAGIHAMPTAESKDMELARRYGCLGIHARYGVARADLVARIRKFAPDRVARRNMQIGDEGGRDSSSDRLHHVDEPLEILSILG